MKHDREDGDLTGENALELLAGKRSEEKRKGDIEQEGMEQRW